MVSGLLIAVASLVEHGLQSVQASVMVEHRLTSCGSQALEHRLSLWCTGLVALRHLDLPRQRIEPVSPALAGGFFTTQPPGKACFSVYKSHSAALRMGVGDADGGRVKRRR